MGSSTIRLDELQQFAPLSHLTPEQLDCLARVMVRRSYSAGEFIFLEAEPASGIWFVLKGRVRIIKHSFNGRVQGLCLTGAGTCFGGCPLFDGDSNPASAQALGEVTLAILPREEMQRLSHHTPCLGSVLLQVFSERFAHLARLSEGLGAWTVASRINDCLLTYAEQSKPFPVARLTHEKLAALAGTAREIVSRYLSRLEADGAVRLEPGQIILLDPLMLNSPCQIRE